MDPYTPKSALLWQLTECNIIICLITLKSKWGDYSLNGVFNFGRFSSYTYRTDILKHPV